MLACRDIISLLTRQNGEYRGTYAVDRRQHRCSVKRHRNIQQYSWRKAPAISAGVAANNETPRNGSGNGISLSYLYGSVHSHEHKDQRAATGDGKT